MNSIAYHQTENQEKPRTTLSLADTNIISSHMAEAPMSYSTSPSHKPNIGVCQLSSPSPVMAATSTPVKIYISKPTTTVIKLLCSTDKKENAVKRDVDKVTDQISRLNVT